MNPSLAAVVIVMMILIAVGIYIFSEYYERRRHEETDCLFEEFYRSKKLLEEEIKTKGEGPTLNHAILYEFYVDALSAKSFRRTSQMKKILVKMHDIYKTRLNNK